MADALLRVLAEAAGGGGAVRQGTELPAVLAGRVRAWVEPADAEGVGRVLGWCTEEGVAVQPAGDGSWLDVDGAGPVVVVSTRRVHGVTEHEPADLAVGVRAGTPLAGLARQLAAHGQELPLDPPGAPGATVGALLALGAAGPLRARHGTPRDLILGVEVVTGDGRLLRYGGRVVKNVAGYDVPRLLVGSRGALGIITGAFLLLRAAPRADRTLVWRAGSAGEAAALALAVRELELADALEVFGPGTMDGFGVGSGPGVGAVSDGAGDGGWQVAVRLRGSAEAVDDAAAAVQEAAGAAVAQPGSADYWEAAGAVEAAAVNCVRFAAAPAALADTLALAGRFLAAAASGDGSASGNGSGLPGGWRAAAHGTAGIVRVWSPAAPAAGSVAALAEAFRVVRAELASVGGTAFYAMVPDALRGLVQPRPAAGAGTERLERALRAAFDPAGILSPGRHWK